MTKTLEVKIIGIGFVILVVTLALSSYIIIERQMSDINNLTRERLLATAKVISKALETTMLQGKADVTKILADGMKFTSGFDGIEVYDRDGREAFTHKGLPIEAEKMKKLQNTGREFMEADGRKVKVYVPLINEASCRGCHPADIPVLGAVKVSINLTSEYEKVNSFIIFMVAGCFSGLFFLGGLMWFVIKKSVVNPIKSLEMASAKMAGGDLTFMSHVNADDEIGRLDNSIKESLRSISSILDRIREVSRRIGLTTDSVEKDLGKVIDGTQLETEAITNISISIEQLNASISEIAESTASLSKSVDVTASSIEEMTKSINSITGITHEVSEGVDSTSSSIEQLSATIRQVADSASELSRVSDDTMSSVDEIMASVKAVEQSAKEAAKLSRNVTDDAVTIGMPSVEKAVQGMENIRSAVNNTASAVEKLGVRSEEIGTILNVIDEIADQTTLLALNAAILAAQAGEHGKGFSVVANEIKDLAERTAFSTKEIENLIQSVRREVLEAISSMGEGMTSVEEGIKLSKDVSSAFRKILDSSRKSSDMSSAIERITDEQGRTARYVSESVEKVREMVNQIARATHEQSKGVNLIIRAAEKIRDASRQADHATKQQAEGSRQISNEVESVAERTQQISKAIYEQKMGANQIWNSVEKIKRIPRENRELSYKINRSIRGLLKDTDLVNTEMERFKLYEGVHSGIYRFGVVPFEAPAELYRRFTPIVEYLSRETGRRFELKIPLDFDRAVKDLVSGETHFCYMTSMTYIKARKSGNADIIVKTLRDGRPYHHAEIVVREQSDIKTVKDLLDRSFAFVDDHSTSGYLVPKAMLLDEGIDLRNLSYYNFLGVHDEVAKAVLSGEFDAGAVMEASAVRYRDKGLRTIAVSVDIPEFNICAGPSLSREEKEAVKTALMKLNSGHHEAVSIIRSISSYSTGFAAADDDDFAAIRNMMTKVGMA